MCWLELAPYSEFNCVETCVEVQFPKNSGSILRLADNGHIEETSITTFNNFLSW
jgi:hypothetical protein